MRRIEPTSDLPRPHHRSHWSYPFPVPVTRGRRATERVPDCTHTAARAPPCHGAAGFPGVALAVGLCRGGRGAVAVVLRRRQEPIATVVRAEPVPGTRPCRGRGRSRAFDLHAAHGIG